MDERLYGAPIPCGARRDLALESGISVHKLEISAKLSALHRGIAFEVIRTQKVRKLHVCSPVCNLTWYSSFASSDSILETRQQYADESRKDLEMLGPSSVLPMFFERTVDLL